MAKEKDIFENKMVACRICENKAKIEISKAESRFWSVLCQGCGKSIDFIVTLQDCEKKWNELNSTPKELPCFLIEYGDAWGVDFFSPNSESGVIFKGKLAKENALFVREAIETKNKKPNKCDKDCPFFTFKDE